MESEILLSDIPFPALVLIFFFCMSIIEPIVLGIPKFFGIYTIVREQQSLVYVLFGKVIGILDEPGLRSPLLRFGPRALVVNWLGSCDVVDTRLDQQYLRSQPVNSEEGAPMGIGIWYEMKIADPEAYLYKNTDPIGSLSANVSNSTIRCLSNLPLAEMLENRHTMSQTVRREVSPKSLSWGYELGSVYIRKVHFRDVGMIRQIEEKVVNRLKQVTSAIRQDGTNRVNVISGAAEREAAAEFARAGAVRPQIVGRALKEIGRDPEVAQALFEVLEIQRISESKAEVTLLPPNHHLLSELIGSQLVTRG